MSPITTHVLDLALGQPAEGIAVTLHQVQADGSSSELGQGATDTDGRVSDLLPSGTKLSGQYRLVFSTADYFATTKRTSFYPRVEILFEVASGGEHYHVPLLLSPFGYSTYRGS